jgi:hypothetical protein
MPVDTVIYTSKQAQIGVISDKLGIRDTATRGCTRRYSGTAFDMSKYVYRKWRQL